jgi:hypothetical protein
MLASQGLDANRSCEYANNMALTDAKLRALRPASNPKKVSDGGGLLVVVMVVSPVVV